jgi:hypothetical protein
MRINLVFYISLLEPISYNVLTITLELVEENKIIKYKVEDIKGQRITIIS